VVWSPVAGCAVVVDLPQSATLPYIEQRGQASSADHTEAVRHPVL